MNIFEKFTKVPMQRYPGDRKYNDPDVPQQEQRTEPPRQRKPGDRKWDNPDVPKNDNNKE